ncbi:MAG: hypothetical protein Q4Q04_01880 [Methanocorpusculum sp.]|nr:hypothetical protein [Methanocorpusculum sp.]
MKFLEHELAEQERELERKSTDIKDEPAPVAVVPEHIERMEMRIRELEAMVKGLTEELLDVKSVTRKLSAQIEKLGGTPVRSHPEASSRTGMRRPEVTAEPVAEPAQARARPQAGPVRPERDAPAMGMRRPVPQTSSAPAPAPAPRRPISAPVPEPVPARRPAQLSETDEETAVANLKAGEYEYVMQQDGTIQKRRKTQAHNVIIAGTGYSPRQTSRSSAIRADSNAVIEAEEDETEELKR